MAGVSTWAAIGAGKPLVDRNVGSLVGNAAGTEQVFDISSGKIIRACATQTYMVKPAAATNAYRWKFGEPSGSFYDDMSGSNVDWAVTAGTVSRGLWTPIIQDGGFNRPAIHLGTTAYLSAPNNTLYDRTTGNFSISGWIRINNPSANALIFDKRNAAGTAGWHLQCELDSRLYLEFSYGSTTLVYITNASSLTRGTWHFFTAVCDKTGTNTAIGMLDGEQHLTPSISAVGNTTTTQTAQIGRTGDGTISADFQLAELMWADGITTLAEHQAMYDQYKAADFGLSYSRTGHVAYFIGSDATGVRVARSGPNQLPLGQFAELVDATEDPLGWCVMNSLAFTNLITRSEDFTATGWTANNATVTARQAEDPSGGFMANTITATAGNGDARFVLSSITAASHAALVCFKRNGGSNVAGYLRLVKNSDNSLIAETAFTATALWSYITVVGTAVLNDTRLEIRITTNTESIYAWGAQLGLAAEWDGGLVETWGATQASTPGLLSLVTAPGAMSGDEGLIEVVCRPTTAAQAADGYLVDCKSGSAEIAIYRNTSEGATGLVKDAGGTTKVSAPTANSGFTAAKHRVTFKWDSGGQFDEAQQAGAPYRRCSGYGGAIALNGGTAGVDGSAPWTPAEADAVIAIGSTTSAGVNVFSGGIQKVRFVGGEAASTIPAVAAVVSSTYKGHRAVFGDVVLANPATAASVVTLPPATTADVFKTVTVVNYSTSLNGTTIRPHGSDTINLQSTDTIGGAYQAKTYMVVSSGAWIVVSSSMGLTQEQVLALME